MLEPSRTARLDCLPPPARKRPGGWRAHSGLRALGIRRARAPAARSRAPAASTTIGWRPRPARAAGSRLAGGLGCQTGAKWPVQDRPTGHRGAPASRARCAPATWPRAPTRRKRPQVQAARPGPPRAGLRLFGKTLLVALSPPGGTAPVWLGVTPFLLKLDRRSSSKPAARPYSSDSCSPLSAPRPPSAYTARGHGTHATRAAETRLGQITVIGS